MGTSAPHPAPKPSRTASTGSNSAAKTSRLPIVAKKREAAQLQKKRSQALEHQLRRVRSRLSSQERKLRTRRLIVLGGLMEKEIPPAALLSKLDRALDRGQDRALFGLPPRSPAGADRPSTEPSAPLEGWRPARLPDGSWGSLYAGSNPTALPQNLVGLTIAVRTRSEGLLGRHRHRGRRAVPRPALGPYSKT